MDFRLNLTLVSNGSDNYGISVYRENATSLEEWQKEHIWSVIAKYTLSIVQVLAFVLNLFHVTMLTRSRLRSFGVFTLILGISLSDLVRQIATFLTSIPLEEDRCLHSMSYYEEIFELYGKPTMDHTAKVSTCLAMFLAVFGVVSKNIKAIFGLATITCTFLVCLADTLFMVQGFELFGVESSTPCGGDYEKGFKLPEKNYLVLKYVEDDDEDTLFPDYLRYSIFKFFPCFIIVLMSLTLIIRLQRTTVQEFDAPDDNSKLIIWISLPMLISELPQDISQVFEWIAVPLLQRAEVQNGQTLG